jgi:hypothetical protein
MILHRLFAPFNSLMFHPDNGRQRIALGIIVASLIFAPSVSALPLKTLSIALLLLLPRRAT